MILKICLAISGILFSDIASANGFKTVYTDRKIGLQWSAALPGTYSNGCATENETWDESKCTFIRDRDGRAFVKPEDSNAARACARVGARLPTLKEFESLVRDFDHTEPPSASEQPRLTKNGLEKMNSIFNDMKNIFFWVSDVFPGAESSYSYYFWANSGTFRQNERLDFDGRVRCVNP